MINRIAAVDQPEQTVSWESSRLWSLWDMLDTHAYFFAMGIRGLSEAKWTFLPLLAGSEGVDPDFIKKEVQRHVGDALHWIRMGCILSDMDSISPEIDRLEQLILGDAEWTKINVPAMVQTLKHLSDRLTDELKCSYYFHLYPRDVPFFSSPHPFGEKVSKKFPKAVEDIDEAGKCLALQRTTACVFHLMRVMERGVQRLGAKLGVKIDIEVENWGKIVDHINVAQKALPGKTASERAKKAKYAAASAYLDLVRQAWRNEVMHPKQTYRRDEAFEIFNATRVFMASLAELV